MLNNITNNLSNFFNGSPLLNFVFLFLTIGSIIIAVIFYLRSRYLRQPTFAIRNINLIKDKTEKINSVEILFQKKFVNNLSVAKIAIWNRGRGTICQADMALADPLRIEAKGGVEILEAKIIYKKQEANNFSLFLSEPSKKIVINFDYFDKDEGIIVQVVHTGKTGNELIIGGTVKGGGEIQKVSDPFFIKLRFLTDLVDKMKQRHKRIFLGLLLLVTPVFFVINKYIPNPKTDSNNKVLIEYLPLLLLLVLYWSTGLSALRRRIPKGFEVYEDEIAPFVKKDQKLKIIAATYGTDKNFFDITKALNESIKDNKLKLTLSNSIAGDPHLGFKKKGEVKYMYDGNEFKKNYIENDVIELP